MATHSSILAWRIPWTEEPGRLQSMGLQRAGHDLATKHQNMGLCFMVPSGKSVLLVLLAANLFALYPVAS